MALRTQYLLNICGIPVDVSNDRTRTLHESIGENNWQQIQHKLEQHQN